MRKQLELYKLSQLAQESLDHEVTWENSAGEIFVFDGGQMIQYTNTKVIHHEDDGLVNLREEPLVFEDESDLPDMWENN